MLRGGGELVGGGGGGHGKVVLQSKPSCNALRHRMDTSASRSAHHSCCRAGSGELSPVTSHDIHPDLFPHARLPGSSLNS